MEGKALENQRSKSFGCYHGSSDYNTAWILPLYLKNVHLRKEYRNQEYKLRMYVVKHKATMAVSNNFL